MSEVPRSAPVLRAAHVRVAPAEAFAVFTDQIGAWWPLPTHGVFGDRAGGLAFDAGRLVERAVDGSESVWGEVLAWEAPERLVVSWHPGRGHEDASEVEARFAADADGTRVEVEHRGWERFGDQAALRRRGYVGPGAWGHVLDHYADVSEPREDGADLTGVTLAYEAFFEEAQRGGFGPAPEGEWGAEQVLAHVALNDLALTAVAQAIVHGRTPDFRNVVCQDPDVLAAEVARSASPAERLARGRSLAAVALVAVARLSPTQRETPVHCVLHHDGSVVLDEVLPWAEVAVATQAGLHLPAHTGQLRDLRELGA